MIKRHHLQRLQLASLVQIEGVIWDEPIDEAIRTARLWSGRAATAAHVFDDDELTLSIRLNSLISATPHSLQTFDLGRIIWSGLEDPSTRAEFSGEEEPFGKRIPSGAIECRQPRAIDVGCRQQRDAVRPVRIQVDASNVPLATHAGFMTLKEKAPSVVVSRVGAVLAIEHQICVF